MMTLEDIVDRCMTMEDTDCRQEVADLARHALSIQADVRALYDGLVSLGVATDNLLPRHVRMRFKR